MRKLKLMIITNALKISFIKKWYIGNEILKNPPTVFFKADSSVENISFINTTCKLEKGIRVKDCTFETTYKYPF